MIVISLIFTTLSFGESLEIEYSRGNDYYKVLVTDGKVVGGMSQGTDPWEVVGGSYDGNHLTVVFKNQNNPSSWQTHVYSVHPSSLRLIIAVFADGSTFTKERVFSANFMEINKSPCFCDASCATFNLSSNILHIPCLDLQESEYWLDLTLTNSDPITLELTGVGERN